MDGRNRVDEEDESRFEYALELELGMTFIDFEFGEMERREGRGHWSFLGRSPLLGHRALELGC